MLWFLFAFLTAFFQSMQDLFNKTQLREFDEYLATFSLTFFTGVGLSVFLLFEIPTLGKNFLPALLVGGMLNTLAFTSYVKAIKYYDLSVVTPITALSPLFMLITSPLTLGEFPRTRGLIGIVLIVAGSYILNLKEKDKGYFAPWRSLFTNPGSRLALLVALIWSITANIDKIGVQNSSPTFWAMSLFFCISMLLMPVVIFKSRNKLPPFNWHWLKLVAYGFLGSAMIGCQMQAVNLTLVAYVIAVKRSSALLSIIFGSLILKEKGIKEKLVGAAIMIIGVVAIALS